MSTPTPTSRPRRQTPLLSGLVLSGLGAFVLATATQAQMSPKGKVPNQDYPGMEPFAAKGTKGAHVSPTFAEHEHNNQPGMVNGYLFLGGNNDHTMWDISDPAKPVPLTRFRSDSFEPGVNPSAKGHEAESHSLAFARYPGDKLYVATVSGVGIDIFDVSQVDPPTRPASAIPAGQPIRAEGIPIRKPVASLVLPGINYGDVSNAVWGVSWQGNKIWVGATDKGLFVIDASDPTKAEGLNQSPTPIPPNQITGGMKLGPLFAVGNLLVITSPKSSRGIVTVDISDPQNPFQLASAPKNVRTKSYIGWFYGKYAFLQKPLEIWDVTSDPTEFKLLSSTQTPNSEYMNFADDRLFLGLMRPNPGAVKYDITDPTQPKELGKIEGRYDVRAAGMANSKRVRNDDQFTLPIGNLLVLSDEQNGGVGSVITVHQKQRDTTPPRVLYSNPAHGETQLALSTRVGISFSDQIELRSVEASTFVVRRAGDVQPLAGKWGMTGTVVNFSPDQPLAPNTTYEVLLPAGGVSDLVGNTLAAETRILFSTGTSIHDPGPVPAPPTAPPPGTPPPGTPPPGTPPPGSLPPGSLPPGTPPPGAMPIAGSLGSLAGRGAAGTYPGSGGAFSPMPAAAAMPAVTEDAGCGCSLPGRNAGGWPSAWVLLAVFGLGCVGVRRRRSRLP